MDLWDIASGVGDFVSSNADTISAVGSLGLGAYNAYQGKQAADTAANFYDAAGSTTRDRWDWWKENMAPLEQARSENELWQMEQAKPLQKDMFTYQQENLDFIQDQQEMLQGLSEQDLQYMQEMRDYRGEILPEQKNLYKQGLNVQGAQMDSQIADIEQYEQNRDVEQSFYDQALEGIDPKQEMSRAQADVAQAYKQTGEESRRAALRMGLNPNSGKFAQAMDDNRLDKAKDITSARTGARERAEDTNFARLSSAVNTRQRLGPANTNLSRPGLGLGYAGQNINAPNVQGGRAPNTQQPNPASTYAQLGNAAAQGAQGGMQSGGYWLNQGLKGLRGLGGKQ